MKKAALLLSLIALTACATPVISLKHPKTGQRTHCGGDAGKAIAGGFYGYRVQQQEDHDCVKLRQSEGFVIESVEMQ